MKLSVLTKDGEGTLYLRDSLVITEPSEIILDSATMYWNYNNINALNTLHHGEWCKSNTRSWLLELQRLKTEVKRKRYINSRKTTHGEV